MRSRLKLYKFILGAGESQNLTLSGNVVSVIEATDKFDLSIDSGDVSTMEKGLKLNFDKPFEQIRVTSATAQTIELFIGFGNVHDSRLIIDSSLGMLVLPNSISGGGAISVGATAALVSSAQEGRAELAIQPQDGDIYIGPTSGVTTLNGFRVAQSGSINITHNKAVYAIAAAAVDLRWLSESN